MDANELLNLLRKELVERHKQVELLLDHLAASIRDIENQHQIHEAGGLPSE